MSKQIAVQNAEKQTLLMSENYDKALGLARMLSYAADEASMLGATEARVLITLSLRELQDQFGLEYAAMLDMSAEPN